ncbi:MAG: ATP-binding protein [Eubacteriales bacterium]|nr:ATP-binding protein [Eubacteriales bacterium]
MTFEEIAKLFVPTIENINVLIYLTLFVRKWRFSKKTVFFSCAAAILVLVPYNIWCSLNIGTERIDVYRFTPLCHGVLILLIFVLGKMEHGRLLFSISVSYMLIFLCSTLSRPFEVGSYYFQSFVRLDFFIIFVYLNYRYHRPRLLEAMEWIERGWYALSMIPLSLIALVFYTGLPNNYGVVYYAITLESFLIYVILLWLFALLKRQHQMERERSLLQTQVSAIRQHCDQLQDVNMDMRIIRHDIRHYCQLMENAVLSDDKEEVSHILEQIKNKVSASQSDSDNTENYFPVACQNSSSVNSLLNYYKHMAEKQGISIKLSLVMPEKPSFDIIEFCVLISNGLENAIHACMEIPDEDKRKIVISGEMKQAQFFLEIKNTYHGTIRFQDNRPVTNEKGHGYGVQSICGFASKYNALLDFQADGTWFRLRLLI